MQKQEWRVWHNTAIYKHTAHEEKALPMSNYNVITNDVLQAI